MENKLDKDVRVALEESRASIERLEAFFNKMENLHKKWVKENEGLVQK